MEKYLGNKTSLLPLIDGFLQSRIPEATSLSDVFAGTNNVSRYFRGRGWKTAVCDANRFSYVLAQAYLGTTQRPAFNGIRTRKTDTFRLPQIQREFERGVSRFGDLYLPGQTAHQAFQDLLPLANVLSRLQSIGEANEQPGIISDCFTQWGSRSKFESIRGTQGFRNYFSQNNALFLDGVLATIRQWWHKGTINQNEIFLLLTSIIEEVVITANVSGTFHDFNRDKIWPNAEQSFQLRVPLVSIRGSAAESANADSRAAAEAFGQHDVCYLDPPYNFRQYTAYYHFLNFIAAYPFLDDVEAYIGGLSHVRGQHPEDDFASDFCYRNRFIPSLRRLIGSIDADHVVLSYYGGRNHWNHWSTVDVPTDEGLRELKALFEDQTLFRHCEVVPALEIRKNYQSRVGEQKELVNEYLFHGVLQNRPIRQPNAALSTLPSNVRWGLSNDFQHVVPVADQGIQNGVRVAG